MTFLLSALELSKFVVFLTGCLLQVGIGLRYIQCLREITLLFYDSLNLIHVAKVTFFSFLVPQYVHLVEDGNINSRLPFRGGEGSLERKGY